MTTAKEEQELEGRTYSRINIPMWMGCAIIIGWAVVLVVSLTMFPESGLGGLFKAFFRVGSIIYGGGQVSVGKAFLFYVKAFFCREKCSCLLWEYCIVFVNPVAYFIAYPIDDTIEISDFWQNGKKFGHLWDEKIGS